MTEQVQERYPARFARRLTEVYPELSFTRAKRVIEGGQVSVDGQPLFDPGAYVAPQAQLVWDPNRKLERPVEEASQDTQLRLGRELIPTRERM